MVKHCATQPWFKLIAPFHEFILLAGNICQGSHSLCKPSGKPLLLVLVLALVKLETPF